MAGPEIDDAEVDAFARSLLRAARDEAPARGAYERASRALAAGSAFGAVSLVTSVASGATRSLFALSSLPVAKLSVALVAGGTLTVGGAVYVGSFDANDGQPAPVERRSAAPSRPAPTAGTPGKIAAPDVPTLDVSELPVADPEPRPSRSEPNQDALAAEVAALGAVRARLLENRPRDALDALELYTKTFPAGRLGVEAEVLRIEALLLAGQRERAVVLAKRFLASHPKSPSSARIRAIAGIP